MRRARMRQRDVWTAQGIGALMLLLAPAFGLAEDEGIEWLMRRIEEDSRQTESCEDLPSESIYPCSLDAYLRSESSGEPASSDRQVPTGDITYAELASEVQGMKQGDQDNPEPPPPTPLNEVLGSKGTDWKLEFAPYVWIANISASCRTMGIKSGIHINAPDVVRDVKFSGMAMLEFSRGRYSIFLDGLYLYAIDPIHTFFGHIEEKISDGYLMAAVGLRWDKPVAVRAFVGAQFNTARTTIEVEGFTFSAFHQKEWIDPIVGLRIRFPINRRWSFDALGDVGGYEWPQNTTWQITGLFKYIIHKHAYFSAGYRVMAIDHTSGPFMLNTFNYGPLIGLGIKF